MNKAMLESYARNLVGQIIGASMIVMQTSGATTPFEFGASEWLLVANALWASLVPVALRWANTKDAAFGRVAAVVVAEATKKIEEEVKKTTKKAAKKAVKKTAK